MDRPVWVHMSEHTDERPSSKVARVIDAYDMEGMGEYLESAWTGEDGSRTSLRDLADEFNRSVLAAAIRESGATATDHDVAASYRVLTGDDVSNADTLRKERELERDGVDVAALRRDFVTHQAVYTYLTEYRDAELEDQAIDPEKKIETLERLEGRTAAVGESTLSSLVEADAVTDRDYELFVEVRAVCEECGSDYALVDLIGAGGCDC